MLAAVRADYDVDYDVDYDRPRGPWDTARRVLILLGEGLVVIGALVILYLAFRGPSGHPAAGPAPATASPSSTVAAPAPATSVRPAAVPTTAPPATTAPSAAPSPKPSASRAPGLLGSRAQSYLAGRKGTTEVAVYDLATGRESTLGPQAPQAEQSVVKLEILEAVLHEQQVRRTVLSLSEQQLAPPMIEQNDDSAATTLWQDAGGARGMRAFDHAARLTHTSPGPAWGMTTTTPQDQIMLLRQVAQPSRVLDANSRKYARYLLKNVTLTQRWGVSEGVPAGVTVALKNGAQPLNARASRWQADSVGWVYGGGRNYLIAMLSTGDPGEQYGVETLNHLGAMAWNALGPRRG